MKLLFTLVSLFITLALSPLTYAATTDDTDQAPTAQSTTMETQNDANLLGWLVVVNKTEIAVANEILSRKDLNKSVKSYAEYLVKQHTEMLKDTMDVSKKLNITPDENADDAAALQKQGDDALAKLKSLDDKEVQKAFIDAMVQGHTEALAALDGDIKNQKNPTIKKLLKSTASHVKEHLEKAKAIQKKLKM